MSAFLVSRRHIDLVTDCAMRGPSGQKHGPAYSWTLPQYLDDDLRTADEIGRELWRENLKSIHARYPDTIGSGHYPGPVGVTPFEINGYTFARPGYVMTAGQAAKAIACLRYQSCEHDGWEKSRAADILHGIEVRLLHLLPGYEEAAWDWDQQDIDQARAADPYGAAMAAIR